MTKQKALDIILDAKAKDAELLKMSLEDATAKIAEMQKEFRDEAARLGEDAEEDEDDAQVQGDYSSFPKPPRDVIKNVWWLIIFSVRDILKEMDPSALLTLNMDEYDVQTEGDKRQKKLKDALDKNASKKKFAGLVRKSTNDSGKKGMSFKQYQENLKKVEEQKKAEADRRKQAESNLMSTLAAYGSSSSDEDGENDNGEVTENTNAETSPENTSTEPDEFKVPEIPTQVEQDEESPPNTPTENDPPNLPPGFIDNPDISTDDTKTEELAKAGSKRKSSAEFGTSDFWSSITKKKNI